VPETLDHPPFPSLTWEHYFWVGKLTLSSWAGFQVCHSEGRTVRNASPTDGTVRLSVSPMDADARTPPTADQESAFRHLLDNEGAVTAAVVSALVDYCPGHAYDGDDDVLWNVREPVDLRPLVRLAGVHVLDVVRDGMACVGFEFDCAWDGEHGAGVMTHQGRVIAEGQADCSFTEWIARDGLVR
jgi:hypothetical protein